MFEARKISLLSTLLVLPMEGDYLEQVIRAYRIPARMDKHDAYKETLRRLEEGKRRRIGHGALLLSPVYRIAISTAASLILIFLLQLFLFSQTSIQAGSKAESFRLPDNSRVVLSENSIISYPKYHWNRNLKLQGEAYFEVKKGKKFTVKTNEGSVSVLGTRFLVSEKEDQLDVSCFEGKVAYESGKIKEFIPAGTSKVFSKKQVVETTPLEQAYPTSAAFRANYTRENLQQVIVQLEDFFQVKIQLKTANTYAFSGNLETANLESALKIVSRSLGLHYSFEQDVVVLTENEKSYEKEN